MHIHTSYILYLRSKWRQKISVTLLHARTTQHWPQQEVLYAHTYNVNIWCLCKLCMFLVLHLHSFVCSMYLSEQAFVLKWLCVCVCVCARLCVFVCVFLFKTMGWRFNSWAVSLRRFIIVHKAECVHWGHIQYMHAGAHTHTHSSTTLESHVRQAIKIKAPQKISSVSTGKLLFYLFLPPSPFSFVHFLLYPSLSNLRHISLIGAVDKRSTDRRKTTKRLRGTKRQNEQNLVEEKALCRGRGLEERKGATYRERQWQRDKDRDRGDNS